MQLLMISLRVTRERECPLVERVLTIRVAASCCQLTSSMTRIDYLPALFSKGNVM